MTLTMDLSAPRIEPSTSGYSSPRYSYSTTPERYSGRDKEGAGQGEPVSQSFGPASLPDFLRFPHVPLRPLFPHLTVFGGSL